MAEQGETAEVRLQEIVSLGKAGGGREHYLPSELHRIEVDDLDHLVAVVFRVSIGRDAFPVQVLMDQRQTSDDLLIREARKRAWAMLSAAADATAY